jgi:hypothetical protein
MDGPWRLDAYAAPAPGRLWLVFLANAAGPAASQSQILDDLYAQSPDLPTRDWLKSLAPTLGEVRSFGGVQVLRYDRALAMP